MKALHEKLMKRSAYERWHHHPVHQAVHWLAFLSVALVATFLYIRNIETGFSRDIAGLAPLELPPITPASAGRIVGPAPGRLLIQFEAGAPASQRGELLARHGLREIAEIPRIGVRVVAIGAGQDPAAMAERLNREEGDALAFAEPDLLIAPGLVPDDPWYANWQKDKPQIGAPAAWDVTVGAGDQVLAVADTGVDCAHEDLAARCVPGWNFYDNTPDASDVHGHGTRVAGVAAAIGNNGVGVAGVAWSPKIMPLRVSGTDGTALLSTIASAVVYAADHGAKVVNNSYQSGNSLTVGNAAAYLRGKGGLLVVSEGNYGANTGYPDAADIVSVSAVDAADALYSWSSYGADVDVAAPGCTGATTVNHGGYANFCGTSNAAPETSGTLMLIWAAKPSLTPEQARDVLYRSAKDLGAAGRDASFGWGRIDASAAVTLALQGGGGTLSTLRIIGYQASARTATAATVSWTTDKPSTGTVSYGTSATALDRSVSDAAAGTAHSLTLTGLQKNTKYYYRIHAVAADGTATDDSPVASFRTKAK